MRLHHWSCSGAICPWWPSCDIPTESTGHDIMWSFEKSEILYPASRLPEYLFIRLLLGSGSHVLWGIGRLFLPSNTTADDFPDWHTVNHRERNESAKSPGALDYRNAKLQTVDPSWHDCLSLQHDCLLSTCAVSSNVLYKAVCLSSYKLWIRKRLIRKTCFKREKSFRK